MLILLAGCASSAYKTASEINTISSYKGFIKEHPDSEQAKKAEKDIERLYWLKRKQENTIESYVQYILKYPNGQYISKAKKLHQDTYWDIAQSKADIIHYERYLYAYPAGNRSEAAKAALHKIFWNNIKSQPTVENYEKYINKYPKGKYTRKLIKKLHEIYWAEAKEKNNIESYGQYIKKYPTGKYSKKAKNRIITFFNKNPIIVLKEVPKENQVVDSLLWEQTKKINTFNVYITYARSNRTFSKKAFQTALNNFPEHVVTNSMLSRSCNRCIQLDMKSLGEKDMITCRDGSSPTMSLNFDSTGRITNFGQRESLIGCR